jgi:hypothetical protein
MNNPKPSQLTTTRRDIPSARRLQASKAAARHPEDRPSGLRRTAPADEAPSKEDEHEPEGEEGTDNPSG